MNLGDPYSQNWFVLEPDPGARVLVINSLADLTKLLARFPAPLTYPGSHFIYPDFERIATLYDGIQLTERGQWKTRLTIPTLYGWDTESTLWFRWCFSECRQIAVPNPTPAEPDSLPAS
jgi:hypothetical protein